MRKFDNRYKDFLYLIYRWVSQFIDPIKFIYAFTGFFFYFRDLIRYAKLKDAEKIEFFNTYPCIHDRTPTTPFDSHYFYQDIWAYKKVRVSKSEHHVDVGSRIIFSALLSAQTKVTFIDIRSLDVKVENFKCLKGDILHLPFEDNSVNSLSSLHVIEHVGLGRYGDSLDALGSKKACNELTRVLASGGSLYVSLPIGKSRLCFNGHRVHSAEQIINYFKKLELVELSCVNDRGDFLRNVEISYLDKASYACGLFHFKKG